MNIDVYRCISWNLDIGSILNFRLLSKQEKENFQIILPAICEVFRLRPCKTVKEFITAYAHFVGFWRIVPSFNVRERRAMNMHHNTKMAFLFMKFVTCSLTSGIEILDRFSPIYGVNTDVCQKFLKRDAAFITNQELIDMAEGMAFLGAHFLMKKYILAVQERDTKTQYSSFCKLVEYGTDPYYLKLLRKNKLVLLRCQGRNYLELIFKSQNEYLLKKECKKYKVTIPRHYRWGRGEEICKKKYSRNKRIY